MKPIHHNTLNLEWIRTIFFPLKKGCLTSSKLYVKSIRFHHFLLGLQRYEHQI
jgi:hypothetical protein